MYIRASAEQRVDKRCSRINHVFAVVQDDETG